MAGLSEVRDPFPLFTYRTRVPNSSALDFLIGPQLRDLRCYPEDISKRVSICLVSRGSHS